MSVVGKKALETTILSSASQALRGIGNVSFYAAELVRLQCKRWSVCCNVVKPPLVCQPCVIQQFVGFPFDPYERSVRRHCGVPKVVVLKWEIVAAEGRLSSFLRVWQ